MKKVLIGIGVFFALILAVMAVSWLGTGGARTQADKLIETVKANDATALRKIMASELIAVVEPEKLLYMARVWGLDQARDVAWQKWEISTEGATIDGYFTRADGAQQALHMRFVKQDDAWKLIRFTTDNPAAINDPLALSVPDAGEITRLLAQVTRDFGQGVREKSLAKLHASMSFIGRMTFTPEELDSSFAAFIDNQLDISPAANLDPLLHAPAGIKPDGTLVIEGHYPSRPVQVQFTYSFVNEKGEWLLSGLKLSTVEVDTGAKPRGT